jgi:hypothetical protein
LPYNWGVNDKDPPRPQQVDWVVIDRSTFAPSGDLGAKSRDLLDRMVASPCFALVVDNKDVIVARRTSRDCDL